LKLHKEMGFAKLIILTSLLAIVLSTFILTSVVGVLGLSKHEGAKLWLLASWCLWTVAILIGLVTLLLRAPEKKEPVMEEGLPEGMVAKPESDWTLSRVLSLLMAVCFGSGVITMVIFYAYLILTKLNSGTGL